MIKELQYKMISTSRLDTSMVMDEKGMLYFTEDYLNSNVNTAKIKSIINIQLFALSNNENLKFNDWIMNLVDNTIFKYTKNVILTNTMYKVEYMDNSCLNDVPNIPKMAIFEYMIEHNKGNKITNVIVFEYPDLPIEFRKIKAL